MKLHRVPAGAPLDALAGTVLCHDVTAGGSRLRKGHVLGPDDLAALRGAPELHVIEPEPGDVHEDEGTTRLAHAAAGDGVAVGELAAGARPLAATRRGILDVDADALRRANAVEGVCIYTRYDGQVVDAGEEVARAKVLPLVLEARLVDEAERVARGAGGLVRVRPFVPHRVGAVVQESLGADAAARFRTALGAKLAWLGSSLLEPAFVAPEGDALAAAIARLEEEGAEALVVAGTRAMDPLDASWDALRRLGIAIERLGVPAHPGSMLWIAWHERLPILGMPTCGVLAQATAFDLVLPRVLAGERVGRAELAALGHGGFLGPEMAFRFPLYRGSAAPRGTIEDGGAG